MAKSKKKIHLMLKRIFSILLICHWEDITLNFLVEGKRITARLAAFCL